jgi:hypothetical protein
MRVFSSASARGVNCGTEPASTQRRDRCMTRGEGQGQTPAFRLHALAGAVAVCVRMCLARMHDPPLRAASAHDATQEHRPAIARNAVVMAGYVAADQTPHRSPFLKTDIHPKAKAVPDALARAAYETLCRSAPRRPSRSKRAFGRSPEVARTLTLLKLTFASERGNGTAGGSVPFPTWTRLIARGTPWSGSGLLGKIDGRDGRSVCGDGDRRATVGELRILEGQLVRAERHLHA